MYIYFVARRNVRSTQVSSLTIQLIDEQLPTIYINKLDLNKIRFRFDAAHPHLNKYTSELRRNNNKCERWRCALSTMDERYGNQQLSIAHGCWESKKALFSSTVRGGGALIVKLSKYCRCLQPTAVPISLSKFKTLEHTGALWFGFPHTCTHTHTHREGRAHTRAPWRIYLRNLISVCGVCTHRNMRR